MHGVWKGLAWALVAIAAPSPSAQQAAFIKDQLSGSWTLTSTYLLEEDGKKDDPWGQNVQGTTIFGPGNRFAFMIVAADREKPASSNPRAPVGPLVGHFGSYTATS